jgi:hypothetical protein
MNIASMKKKDGIMVFVQFAIQNIISKVPLKENHQQLITTSVRMVTFLKLIAFFKNNA